MEAAESILPKRHRTVGELLADGTPSYSFEFFPPKTDGGERVLWQALRELEALQPTFVSVTYGAGGSTRDRTIRMTERIATETTLTPLGHLTCVAATRAEVRRVIGQYADAGVRAILALRGDPPGGVGARWEAGWEAATDGRFLARKVAAGAEFAVTQFFFDADDYFRLRDAAWSLGCRVPLVPGVMPVTNVRQITRMAELSGAAFPAELAERLCAVEDDPVAVREIGVEVATDLCERLLTGGAPGLHFYTLNRSTATREIYQRLRLPARV